MLQVTFYGVRGSTPCAGRTTARYGGNTSCVAVTSPGRMPLAFDMGTGFRFFGETQPRDGSFAGAVLVSHLHWDHVHGLPFFGPILAKGGTLDIYGPRPDHGLSLGDAFDEFMRPPYFPVHVKQLPGDIRFHDCAPGALSLGGYDVRVEEIPHIGRTHGYRVEADGLSVAYLPDHQQPIDGSMRIADSALALADGVDLLIHDAQYLAPEFALKATWGHCTVEYAVRVAMEAGARRLALFHHDPLRDDDALDDVVRCTRAITDRLGIAVFAAAEGQVVTVG